MTWMRKLYKLLNEHEYCFNQKLKIPRLESTMMNCENT